MKNLKTRLALIASAAAIFTLFGCLSSNTGPSSNPTHQDSVNQYRSDSISNLANGQLDAVFQELSAPSYSYGHSNPVALKSANAQFNAALGYDPSNSQAKLGAALTSVLLALQSSTLSALVNQAIDAGSPLSVELPRNGPLARASVLRKLAANDPTFPEIHQLQDAVADTLLPVLATAIAQLQAVYNDTAFSLVLTIDGKSREIDHGEVTVLLAGFKTLHALSTLVLAYDLDFDKNGSYAYIDSINAIESYASMTPGQTAAVSTLTSLLSIGSPFLAVRPAWSARLAQVDDNILAALNILRAGLETITTETDPQDNDVLRICKNQIQVDCIDPAAFENGLKAIDTARKYIAQPYAVNVADTTIRVDFAAYFKVQDYKKILPYYAFYPSQQWSSDKPVFYFTNASGTETGNARTLRDLFDQADAEEWSNAELIAELKTRIYWQDPTFQGFLPGTTSAKLWSLIEKISEEGGYVCHDDEEDCGPYEEALTKKSANPTLRHRFLRDILKPTFALTLLGKE